MSVMIVALAIRAVRQCRNFVLCAIARTKIQRRGLAATDGWSIVDQRKGHGDDDVNDDDAAASW